MKETWFVYKIKINLLYYVSHPTPRLSSSMALKVACKGSRKVCSSRHGPEADLLSFSMAPLYSSSLQALTALQFL